MKNKTNQEDHIAWLKWKMEREKEIKNLNLVPIRAKFLCNFTSYNDEVAVFIVEYNDKSRGTEIVPVRGNKFELLCSLLNFE